MIGRIIGNYKIESKLGEGGMGAVYKGVDTMLDREVAIKALRPELTNQTAVVERFRSEAVTLAKLHHPNIATLYSLFRHGDELYMVLEYVRGETLDSILQKRGALPSGEVIPVFCQILDGINHAHEYGIVHRDIKPANMMLTEKGTLKVLDFGIARLLGSNRMTRAGSIIGTLEYMAPEQVKGNETDARTDIYALGMMLYEVLTGRAPFETDNEFELMKLQTESLPPAPRTINPSIPEEVEQAIMRSIQKQPDDRFQTAGDFREALLDAGFAAQGAMRRATNPRQVQPEIHSSQTPVSKPEIHSSQIPISKPDISEPASVTDNHVKETRLGENVAPPAFLSAGAINETRFAATDYANDEYGAPDEQSSNSFFNNLTWIHYAGAGFAAVLLLGFVIIAPLLIFSGGSTNTPGNTQEAKTLGNTAIENKTQKAEVVETPAPTRTPPQSVAMQEETPPEVAPITPIAANTSPLTPGAANTTTSEPKQKRTGGGTAATTASRPAPVKKKGLTAAQKRARLENILSN